MLTDMYVHVSGLCINYMIETRHKSSDNRVQLVVKCENWIMTLYKLLYFPIVNLFLLQYPFESQFQKALFPVTVIVKKGTVDSSIN